MALDRYTGDILKSLKGELLGFDHSFRLVGHNGVRVPQESVTAASTLDRDGTSVLSGTTAVFTLMAPLKDGILKEIINASSISTATMSIVRSTAQGACSFLPVTSGTTEDATGGGVKRINLLQVGSRVVFRSISTSQWAPVSFPQSSLYFTISTSS